MAKDRVWIKDRVRIGVTIGGNIKVEEFIVEGSEGAVFKCRHVATGESCAAKVYNMEVCHGKRHRFRKIKDEISTMVQLNSDYVVQIQGNYVTKSNFEVIGDGEDDQASLYFLVMELATFGDLCDVIVTRGQGLKEKEAVHILHQLLPGLHNLHTASVIHRDFKAENILVFGENKLGDGTSLYRVKIADFGLSKFFGKHDAMDSQAGVVASNTVWLDDRPNNVAPEMHNLEIRDMDTSVAFAYTKAVDLWSLGHATFVMLCGEWPFGGAYGKGHRKDWHASMAVMEMGRSFAEQVTTREWRGLSSEAKDFIDKLLVLKPCDRMTVQQAAQHPFLKLASWPDLPRPAGWTDIDVLDPNCSETLCSDHRVVVQCAIVQNKDLDECFIAGREHLLNMYKNWVCVRRYPKNKFLEIGKNYNITIVNKKDKDGILEWVTSNSVISYGDELCWGHRQEVKAGEQALQSIVGEFETNLLKLGSAQRKETTTKELQCVEVRVPHFLDNCILGPESMCDKSKQKAINMRYNFPALASIVAIVRKNGDRIYFPRALDVMYEGDLILLQRSFAGEFATCVFPLDLISVRKFLQESEFKALCTNSEVTGAWNPSVEDSGAASDQDQPSFPAVLEQRPSLREDQETVIECVASRDVRLVPAEGGHELNAMLLGSLAIFAVVATIYISRNRHWNFSLAALAGLYFAQGTSIPKNRRSSME